MPERGIGCASVSVSYIIDFCLREWFKIRGRHRREIVSDLEPGGQQFTRLSRIIVIRVAELIIFGNQES